MTEDLDKELEGLGDDLDDVDFDLDDLGGEGGDVAAEATEATEDSGDATETTETAEASDAGGEAGGLEDMEVGDLGGEAGEGGDLGGDAGEEGGSEGGGGEEGDGFDLDGELSAMMEESGGGGGGDMDLGDLGTGGGGEIAPLATQMPALAEGATVNLEFLLDIKLHVTFEVGCSKMLISDLLTLGQGSVIELHRLVGDELDLLVNGRLVAKGEVVVVNEKFGCKITEIIPPEERVKHMAVL